MGSGGRGERRWTRREVDFSVRVIFPTRGLKDVREAKLRLCNISEGGAALQTAGLKSIPDFFYLQFGDESSDLVGCYVVSRTQAILHCQFTTEFPTSSVDRIILEQETLAFIDTLENNAMDDIFDDLETLFYQRAT